MSRLRSQDGFTLQELLVALNVAFLIVSFSFMLFLSVSKILASWQERNSVRGTVNGIIQRIATDIQRSERVEIYGDTLMLLEGGQKGAVSYSFVNGKVERNSFVMNANAEVLDVRLEVGLEQKVKVEIEGKSGSFSYRRNLEAVPNPSARQNFIRTKKES